MSAALHAQQTCLTGEGRARGHVHQHDRIGADVPGPAAGLHVSFLFPPACLIACLTLAAPKKVRGEEGRCGAQRVPGGPGRDPGLLRRGDHVQPGEPGGLRPGLRDVDRAGPAVRVLALLPAQPAGAGAAPGDVRGEHHAQRGLAAGEPGPGQGPGGEEHRVLREGRQGRVLDPVCSLSLSLSLSRRCLRASCVNNEKNGRAGTRRRASGWWGPRRRRPTRSPGTWT